MESLAASPFSILDAHCILHLVTDAVHEDDALCLALACRPLRDALWARFLRRPAGDLHMGKRLCTRKAALVTTVARVVWARGLAVAEDEMNATLKDDALLYDAPRLRDEDICEQAARHGALSILQWARADGILITEVIAELAARGGHLAVLKWLWTLHATNSLDREKVMWQTSRSIEAAAIGGHLEVLWWLRAGITNAEWEELPGKERTCMMTAHGGHLAVLQWLQMNGCPWGPSTMHAAARGGHLGVLQWARENGCGWSSGECLAAAQNGHLALLQWLRVNGCEWADGGRGMCTDAARGGHLAVLQYVHANGCDFDGETCWCAAGGGHLPILQWLRANSCPWTGRTCFFAAHSGHLEVLQWAVENGCPWDKAGCLRFGVPRSRSGGGSEAVREWIQGQLDADADNTE